MLNVVYLFHRSIIIFKTNFVHTEVFVRTINSVAARKFPSETIATTHLSGERCVGFHCLTEGPHLVSDNLFGSLNQHVESSPIPQE